MPRTESDRVEARFAAASVLPTSPCDQFFIPSHQVSIVFDKEFRSGFTLFLSLSLYIYIHTHFLHIWGIGSVLYARLRYPGS